MFIPSGVFHITVSSRMKKYFRIWNTFFAANIFISMFFIWYRIIKSDEETHGAISSNFRLMENLTESENYRMLTKKAQMWNCMRNTRTRFSKLSYLNAPIKSLPPYDKSLLPISATTSICDPSVERLRVLVIVNVPWKPDTRMAIRETFANFSAIKHLPTKWTKMFLVGAPRNPGESKLLELENQRYGDIVVVNITEGYNILTLKMLIGFKFVSCFCPNAEYLTKSDDDNYIKIESLDREITVFQEKANKNESLTDAISQKRPPIYLGWPAERSPVRPPIKYKWVVSYNEYSEKYYPTYMTGALYVFSMSIVHRLAVDCPYLCTGLNPQRYATNKEKPCFWRFEDAFIGSCRYFTQQMAAMEGQRFMHVTQWRGVPSLLKTWNGYPKKPVYVTEVTKIEEFYEIAKLLTFQDTLPHNHPVRILLSQVLGT